MCAQLDQKASIASPLSCNNVLSNPLRLRYHCYRHLSPTIRTAKTIDSHRRDRILRIFLRPEVGQFSPHLGAISLLNCTMNLEKREKDPLETIHKKKLPLQTMMLHNQGSSLGTSTLAKSYGAQQHPAEPRRRPLHCTGPAEASKNHSANPSVASRRVVPLGLSDPPELSSSFLKHISVSHR